jgi:hypothetical protein
MTAKPAKPNYQAIEVALSNEINRFDALIEARDTLRNIASLEQAAQETQARIDKLRDDEGHQGQDRGPRCRIREEASRGASGMRSDARRGPEGRGRCRRCGSANPFDGAGPSKQAARRCPGQARYAPRARAQTRRSNSWGIRPFPSQIEGVFVLVHGTAGPCASRLGLPGQTCRPAAPCQQPREIGLTKVQRQASQIIALERQNIEGIELDLVVMLPRVQPVEIGDAVDSPSMTKEVVRLRSAASTISG